MAKAEVQESSARLRGWRLVGTDRWWPAMFGEPPYRDGLRWEPITYTDLCVQMFREANPEEDS